jgi:hypothetical protein
MKTIEIKLYSFEELSPKAREKALTAYASDWHDPIPQSHLINLVGEELDRLGYKYSDDLDIRYSLGYSQGDGLMFIGTLTDKRGRTITIRHKDPMYCHSYTASIDFPEAREREYQAFEEEYRAVCKTVERAGYEYIEYQTSEEYFTEICEANDYTFEEDGTMRNA